jgi:hypothetical protein
VPPRTGAGTDAVLGSTITAWGASIVGVRNRLEILRVRVPRDPVLGSAFDGAVPVIDGTPLFHLFDDRAPGIPAVFLDRDGGQWGGRWGGSPRYVSDLRDGEVVLDGTCGYAECCGLFMTVRFIDDTVVWDEFSAQGGPPIPDGLRFEFDREAYEATLAGFRDEPAITYDELERRHPDARPG